MAGKGYAAALMAGLKETGASEAAPAATDGPPTATGFPGPLSELQASPGPRGDPPVAPELVVGPVGVPLGPHAGASPVMPGNGGPVEAPVPQGMAYLPVPEAMHMGGAGNPGMLHVNGDPMNGLNALGSPMPPLPQAYAPVFTPGMGIMPGQGLDVPLDLTPPAGGDIAENRGQLDEMLGQQFPSVRIRGVPLDAHCEEILLFFHDLTILDVVFSTQPGDAIVLFASMMEVNLARARSGSTIRHRYVEIVPASRREYYDAVVAHLKTASEAGHGAGAGMGALAMGMGMGMGMGMPLGMGMPPLGLDNLAPPPNTMAPGGAPARGAGRNARRPPTAQGTAAAATAPRAHTETLRLRGLPFSASKEDVVGFFRDFSLVEDGVKFVLRADGKVTGEAYVTFGSAEEAKKAMVMDRQSIGSRYIELFPSSPQEAARAR